MTGWSRCDAGWLAGYAIVLASVWVGMLPFGAYPTNDDWVYGKSAEILATTGRLQCVTIDGMVSPTALVPIAAGGGVCRAVGFSYLALHATTAAFAWLGVAAVFGLARFVGARPNHAGWIGAALLVQPWYWQHAFTFMTDDYAAALGLLAALLFVVGAQQNSLGWWMAASATLGAAVWTRQTSLVWLVLPWSVAGWRWLKGRANLSSVIVAVVVASAIPVGCLAATEFGLFGQGTLERTKFVAERSLGDSLKLLVGGGYGAVLVIGFSLLPLEAALSRTLTASKSTLIVAVLALIPLAAFVARGRRAVLTESTGTCLQNAHFGPILTADCMDPGRWGDMGGVVWPTTVWQIATVFACLSAVAIAAAGWESVLAAFRRDASDLDLAEAGLFLTGAAAAAVMLVLMGFHFDRYWMTASIPLAAWAAVRLGRRPPSTSASLVAWMAIVVFAAGDLVFLHDWRAFNACRWGLVEEYLQDGLSPDQVDGGYEVNGWFRAGQDPNTRKLPGQENARWWSGKATRCIAVGPRAGWEIERSREWKSLAVGRPIVLYGLHRRDRSAAEGS